MKKKLRFLLFIAAVTAGGILLFQWYWVYNTYETAAQNLDKLLTATLQRSIDNYQVQQIKLPVSLDGKSPHLDVMEWKSATPGDTGKNGAVLKFNEVSVDSAETGRVKMMIARLLAAQADKPVRMDVLKQFFREELRKNKLDLPFNLLLLKHQQQLPDNKIAGYISLSGGAQVVVAEMNDISRLLFRQNLLPALVSLTLILLSGGSLFYMWIVVRRQLKLDSIKNAFISNLAHELRTPLSILKSTHEILIDFGGMNDPEKMARYLKTNRDIIQKLDTDVERILDINQLENGARPPKSEKADIGKLAAGVIARFNAKEEVHINLINEDGLTQVVTDSYIIDTVISNLIENAVKYGGNGVRIVVSLVRLKDNWQISIADNGKGIAPEHLPFIFDPFYRVPSGDLHEVKGYGLGLSFVRQLVSSLDGTIEASSKLNTGTTFTVKFPQRWKI